MKKLISAILVAALLVLPLGAFARADRTVSLDIEQEWQNFDLGGTHTAAVHVGGHANAWGYNYNGPTGNGSGAASNVTSPYNFADGVKAVEANGKTTLYIDNNDVLWLVGQQYYGVAGNQGSNPLFTLTPVQVDTDVKQVSFGSMHFMYVKNDGTLWTWGQNVFGELGDGTTTQNYTPKQILTGVAWCSAGYEHSAALKTDGTLYMWGMNDHGQVGNGSTTTQKTPVQVLTNVAAVSINGYHSCALKNDGTLWTWGDNTYGQCGNGSTSDVTSPKQVLTGVAQVSAGVWHTGVLKQDGTAWFCGSNYRGAFGNGSSVTYSTAGTSFVQTSGSYVAVKCGDRMTGLVTPEGELLMAGENTYGKLGLGFTGNPDGDGPFVSTLTGNGIWLFGNGETTYYTVTFKDWDGTVLSTQQVAAGSAAVAPANPSRTGYTFAGWDKAFNNITGDTVVTATYTVNSYRLTIYYRYANGSTAATTYTALYNYGSNYSVASPAVSGYTPDIAVVSGVMGAGSITVTVTYTKDSSLLLGDADCNGTVDFADISLLYLYLTGQGSLTEQGILNSDFDQNGSVDFSDISQIYLYIIGG